MPLKSVTEGELKAVVMAKLRQYRGILAMRIEDTSRSGIPDIYVAGGRKSSWWEVKLGRPSFETKEIQRLTCAELDLYAGHCRFVIYRMNPEATVKQVSIARPRDLHNMDKWETVGGFNHDWVVEHILGAHR